MISLARTIFHDRAAWIGTIGSSVSTGIAVVETKSWTPTDLQGWLAATLSLVTIIYIMVKIYHQVQWRKVAEEFRRKVAADE